MKDFIKSLDFLGPVPALRIASNSRYQTVSGGVLSTLSVMIIATISILFSITTFSRKSPQIILNEKEEIYPSFNFTEAPIFFNLMSADAKSFPQPERLYKVKAFVNSYSGYETKEYDNLLLEIDYECHKNYEKYYPKQKGLYKNGVPVACIVPNNIPQNKTLVSGNLGDGYLGFQYLRIMISPCVNDSSMNNCYDQEYIDEALYFTYFNIGTLDYKIDHYNLTDPLERTFKSALTEASYRLSKRLDFYFSNIEYNSNNGLLLPDIVTENVRKVGKIEKMNDPLNLEKNNLINCYIHVSSIKKVYNRKYPKVQNLLADIGGIIKGILFTSSFVVGYFSETKCTVRLANKLIFIDKETRFTNKKSISIKNGNILNNDNLAKLQSDKNKKTSDVNNLYGTFSNAYSARSRNSSLNGLSRSNIRVNKNSLSSRKSDDKNNNFSPDNSYKPETSINPKLGDKNNNENENEIDPNIVAGALHNLNFNNKMKVKITGNRRYGDLLSPFMK